MANYTDHYQIKFDADIQMAKQKMAELSRSLSELSNLKPKAGGSALNKDIIAASQSAQQLVLNLQKAINTDTGKLNLKAFSKELQKSGMTLADYQRNLAKMGPTGEAAFRQLSQAIITAEKPMFNLGAKLKDFGQTLLNTAKWSIASGAINTIVGGVQKAFSYSQQLDRSLNNIRIVTGQSAKQMDEFAKKANKAAKELNTTTTAYTDASLIFYQQGLSDAEVEKRTETVIKMSNVTGEAAADVSSYMTAIWNNFDDGTKSLEYYGDAMAALGAATASSTDEIAAGLDKFAAIADTVGLSYEYATSALATVVSETRQSADVVGTAFKTIFSRLEGLQLGDTLDDGTTLNKYSEALSTVGVNIKKQNGELKDMDTILDEMGAKWKLLSTDQQVALAQTVAGTRQYTQLISLMENYDTFKVNVDIASNAEGTLKEQADIYAESWSAAKKEVSAAAEGIYDSLINEDTMIKITNMFGDLLDAVGLLVEGFEGFGGILPLISTILLKMFGDKVTSGVNSVANGIINIKNSFRDKGFFSTLGNMATGNLGTDLRQQALDLNQPNNKKSASTEESLRQEALGNQYVQQTMYNQFQGSLTDDQKALIEMQMSENKAVADRIMLLADEIAAYKQKKQVMASTQDMMMEASMQGKNVDDSADDGITIGTGIDLQKRAKAAENVKRVFSDSTIVGTDNKVTVTSFSEDDQRKLDAAEEELELAKRKRELVQQRDRYAKQEEVQKLKNNGPVSDTLLSKQIINQQEMEDLNMDVDIDEKEVVAEIESIQKKIKELKTYSEDGVRIKFQAEGEGSMEAVFANMKQKYQELVFEAESGQQILDKVINQTGVENFSDINITGEDQADSMVASIESEESLKYAASMDQASNVLSEFEKNLSELGPINQEAFNKGKQQIDNYKASLNKAKGAQSDMQDVSKKFKQGKATYQELEAAVKKYNTAMQELKKSTEEANAVEFDVIADDGTVTRVKGLAGVIKDCRDEARQLNLAATETGQNLDQMANAPGMKTLVHDTMSASEESVKLRQQTHALGETLNSMTKVDIGQVFTQATTTISQSLMMAQGLKSIITTIGNSEATFGEKLTSILMGVTMVLPLVNTLIQGFTTNTLRAKNAELLATTAKKNNLTVDQLKIVKTKQGNLVIQDSTRKTLVDTGVQHANNTAKMISLGLSGALAAALAVVSIVTAIQSKNTEANTKAIEDNNNSVEKNIDKYKQQISILEELAGSLNEAQAARDGSTESEEKYFSAANKVIEILQDESLYVDKLTNNYNELANAIKQATINQLGLTIEATKEGTSQGHIAKVVSDEIHNKTTFGKLLNDPSDFQYAALGDKYEEIIDAGYVDKYISTGLFKWAEGDSGRNLAFNWDKYDLFTAEGLSNLKTDLQEAKKISEEISDSDIYKNDDAGRVVFQTETVVTYVDQFLKDLEAGNLNQIFQNLLTQAESQSKINLLQGSSSTNLENTKEMSDFVQQQLQASTDLYLGAGLSQVDAEKRAQDDLTNFIHTQSQKVQKTYEWARAWESKATNEDGVLDKNLHDAIMSNVSNLSEGQKIIALKFDAEILADPEKFKTELERVSKQAESIDAGIKVKAIIDFKDAIKNGIDEAEAEEWQEEFEKLGIGDGLTLDQFLGYDKVLQERMIEEAEEKARQAEKDALDAEYEALLEKGRLDGPEGSRSGEGGAEVGWNVPSYDTEDQTVWELTDEDKARLEEIENKQAQIKSDEMALEREEFGVKDEDFLNFIELAEEMNLAITDDNEALAEFAQTAAFAAKGTDDLSKHWKDSGEQLLNYKNGTMKMTSEIKLAFKTMAKDLSRMFNGVNITAEFVEQNLELIQKAAEGDAEAFKELSSVLSMQELEQARGESGTGIDPEEWSDDWEALKNEGITNIEELNAFLQNGVQDLEFGATLDDSEIYPVLQTMLASSQMTAEEMNDFLKKIGFQPKIGMMKLTTRVSAGQYYTTPSGDRIKATQDMEAHTEIPYIIPEDSVYTNPGASLAQLGKKSSGGGSKKTKKAEDEIERYHETERELEALEREAKLLGDAKDEAFGQSKVALIDQEIEALERELETYEKLEDEIESYLAQDRANIAQYGATFDERGNINNYDEMVGDMLAKYNAGSVSEEEYEGFKDYLEQYEETLDKWYENQENKIAKQREIVQKEIEKIDAKVEIDLELSEKEIEWIEYQLGKLEDTSFAVAESIDLISSKVEQTIKDSETYQTQIKDLYALAEENVAKGLYVETGGFNNDMKDKLNEATTNLLDVNNTLLEARKQIQEQFGIGLDEMNSQLDEQIGRFDSYGSILSHYTTILGLSGKSIKDAGLIIDLGNKNVENSINKLESTYQKQEALEHSLAVAQQKYEEALARGDSESVAYWQEEIEKVTIMVEEGKEQVLATFEETLQAAADNFAAAVEQTVAVLSASLTKFDSLDIASDQYEKQKTLAEQFLDANTQAYELSKLMRTVNGEIAKTDNLAAKTKLRDVLEEINEIQSSNAEITQYDLDMLNAKYELRLAEIALEEAQNAKSQVRLTQTAGGGWGYVYTADQSKMDSAQQNYEDKLYAIQQLSEERISGLSDNILANYQEFTEALGALKAEEFESKEAYLAEVDRITQYYADRDAYLHEQLGIAVENSGKKYNDTLIGEMEQAETWEKAHSGFMEDAKIAVENLDKAYANWETQVSETYEAAGLDEKAFKDQVVKDADEISKASEEVATKTEKEAQAYSNYLTGILTQISNFQSQYGAKTSEIITANENIVTSTNNMVAGYARAATAAQQAAQLSIAAARAAAAAWAAAGGGGSSDAIQSLGANADTKIAVRANSKTIWVNGNLYVQQATGRWVQVDEDSSFKYGGSSYGGWLDIVGNNSYSDEYLRSLGASFDTGGYTGEWGSNGRLAMLHEKEIVLNQSDTRNLLTSIEIVRSIAQQLDALGQYQRMFDISAMLHWPSNNQPIEQNVYITAEFPDATDRHELEEAFNNLMNYSSQYINRYNK